VPDFRRSWFSRPFFSLLTEVLQVEDLRASASAFRNTCRPCTQHRRVREAPRNRPSPVRPRAFCTAVSVAVVGWATAFWFHNQLAPGAFSGRARVATALLPLNLPLAGHLLSLLTQLYSAQTAALPTYSGRRDIERAKALVDAAAVRRAGVWVGG
jgi:hypothetical protein